MRHPAAPVARRLGRLAAALAVVAGLAVLQSLVPAAAHARPGAASARATAVTAGSAVTVTGPAMYHAPHAGPSTVTVSQTRNLVNQMVTVKWTNFTPSLQGGKPSPSYSLGATAYPVVIAECRGNSPGTKPADVAKCFGAANPGLTTPAPPYGQTTEVYATTSPTGSGTANIQLETSLQNQQLGCDAKHDCSLIVLPAQGGVPGTGSQSSGADCSNHTFDQFRSVLFPHYATADNAFQVPQIASIGSDFCSWPKRIVIPLHFSKTARNCGFSRADFSVEGSPFMQRAMTSWQTGVCNLSSPISVAYSGQIGEPQARSDFAAGATDVALTSQPASGPGRHPYTYAPVGVSAAAVAYWLDNTKTGLPYPSGLKLTPLLLLKSLTQSYTYTIPCGRGVTPTAPLVCDPGVSGDKTDLLSDPQFTALNPGLNPPFINQSPMVPTVQGDNSDLTWQVTSWIADNKDSAGFLAGQALPDGEHLNSFYLGTQYPTQAFQQADSTGWPVFSYQPVSPAPNVALDQVNNSPPSFDPTNAVLNAQGQPTGGYNRVPAQQQGVRTLMAVLDEPDAAAFLMPTFALQNPAGKYVTPTTASMAAAVKDMTVNPDGITRADNPNAKSGAAYPLTMVSYAMVPTGGISKHKAAKIADWLDYVAGRGQHPGTSLGQLPPGYLPLPGFMRKQTLKAANQVRNQTGDHGNHGPGGGGPGGGGPGGGPGGGGNPGGGSSGTGSSNGGSGGSGSGSPTHTSSATKANAAYSSPGSSGLGRWLPILLIIGALLALGGSSAVVFGRPGSRAAVIAGWHRVERFTLRRGR